MPGGGSIQGLAFFEIRKSRRRQTEICAQANKQFFHLMARLKFFLLDNQGLIFAIGL
jgi:hypothetical protein